MNLQPERSVRAGDSDETELVARVASHDHDAFELVMRRHNSRLFRVARAILRDDEEAEDALQDAYLSAYRHIDEFRGGARLATWLTRIVVNQSLMRLRKERRHRVVLPIIRERTVDGIDPEREVADNTTETPPQSTLRAEIRRLLERRIDELPLSFRAVFVMREVDEMSVEETAESLDIPSATVRTRLFRARALLRETLAHDIHDATMDVFKFAGARCDRIVAGVLARAGELDRRRP